MSDDALAARRAALEAIGFVVVEHLPDGFVAMRRRWFWDVFSRLTHVARVRAVHGLERAAMTPGNRELEEAFRRHDTGRIPRGFQHGWALVDVWLDPAPDPDAVTYARSTVAKGYGRTWHPVVVTDGEPAFENGTLFGRAYWPKTRQVIEAAAAAQVGPEPASGLGTLAGVVMAANALIVSLMCCGVPLIAWLGLAALESDIQPALEG
jgi:hypothetical protein